MKAVDIRKHLQEIGTWVNWHNTADNFILGDPETEVKAIAVAWQARTAAIKRAVQLACNLFITHEQVFYPEPQVTNKGELQQYETEKRKLIEESGIVVLRCHDTWDQMPKWGIVDSWAEHLGLKEKLASGNFEAVYSAPVRTAIELARYVADRTRDLGQDSVEMIGDPEARITKVAIGCGAGTNYGKMVQLGADAIIGTDDGMRYWADGSWALDRGTPLVLVHHCVSEEPGMKNLTTYLKERFSVRTEYIPQGSMYRTVGP